MSKVRNFAEIAPNIGFSEFDFYDLYRSTFEKSELGRIKHLLPLREMAENFGLVSKSMKPKLGRKSYFTPEGKVALMFLKTYTGPSCPRLMEQLDGNIHYQLFCDVIIDPTRPLTNCKLLDDVMLELAGKLKIQQQDILAAMWRPYVRAQQKAGDPPSEDEVHRRAEGGQDREAGAVGGCLTLKHAHENVLSQGDCAFATDDRQKIRPKRPE